jgi:hypothetical protein
LEFDVALFGDRRLLDGNHLALHLGELGRGLLVTTDEKGGRPEDNDRGRGGDAVFGPLTILSTGKRSGPGGYRLSLERKLLAIVRRILNR